MWTEIPRTETPPDKDTPWTETPPGGLCSGRYVSYWNALLSETAFPTAAFLTEGGGLGHATMSQIQISDSLNDEQCPQSTTAMIGPRKPMQL